MKINKTVKSRRLDDVKVGDMLVRVLGANGIPMSVIVGEIKDGRVKVGSADGMVPWEIGWTFDQATGAEIDEELGWGPEVTGSYITHKIE